MSSRFNTDSVKQSSPKATTSVFGKDESEHTGKPNVPRSDPDLGSYTTFLQDISKGTGEAKSTSGKATAFPSLFNFSTKVGTSATNDADSTSRQDVKIYLNKGVESAEKFADLHNLIRLQFEYIQKVEGKIDAQEKLIDLLQSRPAQELNKDRQNQATIAAALKQEVFQMTLNAAQNITVHHPALEQHAIHQLARLASDELSELLGNINLGRDTTPSIPPTPKAPTAIPTSTLFPPTTNTNNTTVLDNKPTSSPPKRHLFDTPLSPLPTPPTHPGTTTTDLTPSTESAKQGIGNYNIQRAIAAGYISQGGYSRLEALLGDASEGLEDNGLDDEVADRLPGAYSGDQD